jgi:hypothetical protein
VWELRPRDELLVAALELVVAYAATGLAVRRRLMALYAQMRASL